MNNKKLKPCPFCGNEAVSIQSEPDHPEYGSGGRFYYVRCPSCRAQSGSKYAHEVCPIFYSEVRQEWNNRAAPPAPVVVKAPEFNVHAQDLISDIETYRGRVSDELINNLIAEVKRMATRADWFLSQAIEEMKDRAASRDTDGERSMKRCVDAFNAMFGKDLTEVQGWQFMEMLKIARSHGGNFRADDFTDAAAYAALAGEAASGK